MMQKRLLQDDWLEISRPIMLVELYVMLYNTQATARSRDWASVLSLGVLAILVVTTNVITLSN